MCTKNPPSSDDIQTSSIMKRTQKQSKNSSSFSSSSSSSSLKRRNRSKTRKPKFVSLRLKLSQPKKLAQTQAQPKAQQQPQLNLFPLHPENLVDMHEENNVALLFSSDGGATLNGLLEDESTTAATATTTTTTTSASEEGSLSAMTCPAMELVRKAMRKKERESEERWVSYSEVVEEKKEMMEEVNSCCGGANTTTSFGLLSLKLDHEGILNAWSDKGSLYVAGDEAPQAVPDVLNGLLFHNALVPNVPWDGWGSSDVGNTWKVPEDSEANKMKVKEETGWKLGQREASVQRYKEKRQSRLFSKRIRYEVRKLNAEKRPRMKGRFVKRE